PERGQARRDEGGAEFPKPLLAEGREDMTGFSATVRFWVNIQSAVVEPAARRGWLLLTFRLCAGIAAVAWEVSNHDPPNPPASFRRSRRAPGGRGVVLDVRDPAAPDPDGA